MLLSSVYFTAPGKVSVRQDPLHDLLPGQVLVQTLLSAISPGTELLVYRGQFPQGLLVDETISSLGGDFRYPLKYGYAAVGRVIAVGEGLDPAWEGRLVFAFHPHESHFAVHPDELLPIPEDIPADEAVFLPNMETAVNFILDGVPRIGERAAVFGQGIVGLLTAALLAQFPLDQLVTLDRYPLRRKASIQAGAHACLDPADPGTAEQFRLLLPQGADLVYELSGAPSALDSAIDSASFDGRVVVGSWYGSKRASLDLGGRFHRSRIRLISSQVSTLSPELTGRWTKARRFEAAWQMLRRVRPSRWITQRFPLEAAPQAYRLLDQEPERAIQVVFDYGR
jgi:2-desacetyl-2-hydroxyethyl bacteriochlorophyllide A dehydrogenase